MYDENYPIRERSIAWAIALSFVTLGIYMLYWIYKLQQETNRLMGLREETSPGLVVFLCIITFGIYQVYWAYSQGNKFREEALTRGSGEANDCPTLYLILQLFNYLIGVTSIVNLALMQDRLNNLLRMRGIGNRPYDPNRFSHVPEADIARRYKQRAAEYEDATEYERAAWDDRATWGERTTDQTPRDNDVTDLARTYDQIPDLKDPFED